MGGKYNAFFLVWWVKKNRFEKLLSWGEALVKKKLRKIRGLVPFLNDP